MEFLKCYVYIKSEVNLWYRTLKFFSWEKQKVVTINADNFFRLSNEGLAESWLFWKAYIDINKTYSH